MKSAVTFEQALTAIAAYVFATSENFDGRAVFYYFGTNGLDVAPDILARSKIMEWGEKDRLCDFKVNWRPGQTLPISRDVDEATEAELQIAMVHIIRWNSFGTEPITIRDQKPVENPVPGSEVFAIAMKEITECLTAWGLGTLEGNLFSLTDAGHSIPEAWEYWSLANRNRRVSHFKRQDTKKDRSRNYKKYKELYDKY